MATLENTLIELLWITFLFPLHTLIEQACEQWLFPLLIEIIKKIYICWEFYGDIIEITRVRVQMQA
jgi:hypothetical protein